MAARFQQHRSRGEFAAPAARSRVLCGRVAYAPTSQKAFDESDERPGEHEDVAEGVPQEFPVLAVVVCGSLKSYYISAFSFRRVMILLSLYVFDFLINRLRF